MEARRTYDQVPEVYEQGRRGYPDALFDDLFDLLPTRPQVLEIGPGTGKATRALLERGALVHAVELGPALASRLQAALGCEALVVEVGNFEDTPASAGTFDCVFAASAFHWLAPSARLDRPATLLRPGGLLAVVDLIRVESPADRGFFAAADRIYARHGQTQIGPTAASRDQVRPEVLSLLEADPRYSAVRSFQYDWDQTFTAATYRLLMETSSVLQLMAPDARTALLDDVESMVRERFDDEVVGPVVASLAVAKLADPRPAVRERPGKPGPVL